MISQAVLLQTGLDNVVFIPTACPPHRYQETDLVEGQHRLKMVRLAVASNPAFQVSDIEFQRQTDKSVNYTVDTIRFLQKNPSVIPNLGFPISVIMGSDAMAQVHTWHQATTLAEMVCFLQIPRPGCEPVYSMETSHLGNLPGKNVDLNTRLVEMPPFALSASWIRQMIRQLSQLPQQEGSMQGMLGVGSYSENKEHVHTLKYFLPERVLDYILANGLYREENTSERHNGFPLSRE